MGYLGGKSKIRKQVALFLESKRAPGQLYFEPFVGGGWILQEMSGWRVAADGNEALISMYQALQRGWVPPEFVSEADYAECSRIRDVTDPMTAFCGVGCSFSGKWFGGYARSDTRNYAANARSSLKMQLPAIRDAVFSHGLFHQWQPRNALVYCDPPYANTTKYGAFDGFDHDLFWQTMREWVAAGNTVVVSEYSAPSDFSVVAEFETKSDMHVAKVTAGATKSKRVERMFMHESQQ
jgi:DNA adenine methylase